MTRRGTAEWIGKTPETATPQRVKARIVDRQGGVCGCGCGVKLAMCGEPIEFDHTQALINGGENRESNIRALRPQCHKPKTRADVAEKSKVAKKRAAFLGIKPDSKSPLPGGRKDKWKRKVGGGVVPR